MLQVTLSTQNQALSQRSLGEAKQDANGIVSYDYGTKLAGAYTLGIISYMLLETEYKTRLVEQL